MADQVHRANVNPELERRRGDQGPHFSRFELFLGRQAQPSRQTPVMRFDGRFAQPLAQVVRDALGKPPRVDEYQGRTMLPRKFGQAVVNFLPHFVRRHRAQRA